jgi:hypothetical protein
MGIERTITGLEVNHISTAPHSLTFYSHRYLLTYDCTFRTYINTCHKHIAYVYNACNTSYFDLLLIVVGRCV